MGDGRGIDGVSWGGGGRGVDGVSWGWGDGWGMDGVSWGLGGMKRYKLPAAKLVNHEYEMYNVGKMVKNCVPCLYRITDDDNEAYHGNHFVI